MRPFKFRLESLLRIRQQAREQAQLAVADALQQVEEVRDRQTELQHQRKELEQHMRSAARKQNVEVDRLLEGHRHQLSLQARMAELSKAMGEATAEVERCRKKLVEADRQVKVLEKLHEKQLAEHHRKLAHEEHKQNDEIAVIRAARRA